MERDRHRCGGTQQAGGERGFADVLVTCVCVDIMVNLVGGWSDAMQKHLAAAGQAHGKSDWSWCRVFTTSTTSPPGMRLSYCSMRAPRSKRKEDHG